MRLNRAVANCEEQFPLTLSISHPIFSCRTSWMLIPLQKPAKRCCKPNRSNSGQVCTLSTVYHLKAQESQTKAKQFYHRLDVHVYTIPKSRGNWQYTAANDFIPIFVTEEIKGSWQPSPSSSKKKMIGVGGGRPVSNTSTYNLLDYLIILEFMKGWFIWKK